MTEAKQWQPSVAPKVAGMVAGIFGVMWSAATASFLLWAWPRIGPWLMTPCPMPSKWAVAIVALYALQFAYRRSLDRWVKMEMKNRKQWIKDHPDLAIGEILRGGPSA